MQLSHHDMTLTFDEAGRQHLFFAGSAPETEPFPAHVPVVAASTLQPFDSASTQASSPLAGSLQFVKQDGDALVYASEAGLTAAVTLQPVEGAAVWRVHTVYTNNGNTPITLNYASAASVQGAVSGGLMDWEDSRRTVIHTCTQTWNGEGQWHQDAPETLGLYRTSTHPLRAAVRLSSVGSWSTGSHYPAVMVEDKELGTIWYFVLEHSGSWHIEIGHRSGWDSMAGALYVNLDAADERTLGWYLTLAPGESYTSPTAALGCCKGGFTEAVAELTRYRRTIKPADPWKLPLAVVFNDYMDCHWAQPTREKLLPLIDAAAAAGCEGFCIDAGWYGALDKDWGGNMGDWEPSPDRFGAEGLAGILSYIKSRGMKPGVWLEIEVAATASKVAKKPDDWFLTRNGARVLEGTRYFMNFGNPEVRAYLHGVVDRLTDMGCEYFKNDYNASIQNGCDNYGTSPAEGLNRHLAAFYSWIDEVKTRHPGVVIENCGSGAMRSDGCALSHMDLQSSSDQEDYRRYPSVLTGSLCNILPEQLGIWSYPWPMLFGDMQHPELLDSAEYQARMADGEQTIFNMVNGLCGRLYLSGRIDRADALNTGLIGEGVAAYKSVREHIGRAVPVLPLGHKRYNDTHGFTALGLRDGRKLLLAVWRLDEPSDTVLLPIKARSVETVYPLSRPAEAVIGSESLSVRLPKAYSARMLMVELKD